jgi:NAD kinase
MIALAAKAPPKALRPRREKVVIVTRKTRLEELVARFNTVDQARFYLERAGESFAPIEREHQAFHAVLDGVRALLPKGVKQQVIDREFLPQFSFGEHDLVVTVGPDGLVVNTAKYLDGQPIVALNPDPLKIEGVLLPFSLPTLASPLATSLYGEPSLSRVTMAEAVLGDGQRLLAFNDLFIGAKSHVSARYRIEVGGRAEDQSSSGIIVATGAGSTGWLRSVFVGAARVTEALGGKANVDPATVRFPWNTNQLVYAVREPWPSKATGASLAYGVITEDNPLMVHSQMSERGVIFSDGVVADYLDFNAGATAMIQVSRKCANLVVAEAKTSTGGAP